MSLKIFDFNCTNPDCPMFALVQEQLVQDDAGFCDSCGRPMQKLVTATTAKPRVSTYRGKSQGKLRNVFKKVSDD